MDTNNPAPANADGSQLNPAAPDANAGTITPPIAEALNLSELNQLLGREFKSKESALKSIKDTFNFATTRVSDIASKVDETTRNELKRLNDTVEAQNKELFYTQNPGYAQHRKLIDSLGKNPAEVIQTEIFKDTYNKLEEHGKTAKLKTVLESNPRLAASRDGLTKAAELKRAQNGFVTESVEKLVTDAVIDAFDLRK